MKRKILTISCKPTKTLIGGGKMDLKKKRICLNEEEAKIVYRVLFSDLCSTFRDFILSYYGLSNYYRKGALKEIEKELETERNIFRRIKKVLSKELSEIDRIAVGLAEEVSRKTLEKYANEDVCVSAFPAFNEAIHKEALYLLHLKKAKKAQK